MWRIDDALMLVRKIQPKIRPFSYHVALGGGVLNKGESDEDLDLYFIPFSEQGPDPLALRTYLISVLGTEYNLGGPSVRPADVNLVYPDEPTWVNGRFTYCGEGRRVDVFIA
jgi:hypothetical protein